MRIKTVLQNNKTVFISIALGEKKPLRITERSPKNDTDDDDFLGKKNLKIKMFILRINDLVQTR